MIDEVLEVKDVAAMLKCDDATVEERTRAGDLPGLKFGRSWIYPRAALLARLSEMAAAECALRRAPRGRPLSSAARVQERERSRRRAPPALPPCPD